MSKISWSRDLFIFEDWRRKSVRRFVEESDFFKLVENQPRHGSISNAEVTQSSIEKKAGSGGKLFRQEATV